MTDYNLTEVRFLINHLFCCLSTKALFSNTVIQLHQAYSKQISSLSTEKNWGPPKLNYKTKLFVTLCIRQDDFTEN